MNRWRHRPWPALVLAAVVLLAACGGGDDGGTGGGAAPGGTSESGAPIKIASDGEPQEGNTLVELAPAYLDNFDPQKQSSTNTQNMVGPAYSRLLAFRVGDDIDYGEQELEGDLATDWEISEDGLTYTFHLRDDVVWHDIPLVNGRPFVAQDVVASMNRVKNEGFAAYMLENVNEIVAVDDHTVEFRLSAPFAPLTNYLASHYMWILPEESTNGGFDPARTTIGTGPFVIASHEPNVEIVYEANPDYYGEGPYIDGFRPGDRRRPGGAHQRLPRR